MKKEELRIYPIYDRVTTTAFLNLTTRKHYTTTRNIQQPDKGKDLSRRGFLPTKWCPTRCGDPEFGGFAL